MYRLPVVIFFIAPLYVLAQVTSFGIPNIRNYPKSEYNGGTQNWDIAQDKNGFMYFANNDGLLSFDGSRWNLNEISPTSPLRTVFADSQNRLLWG